MPLVSFNPTKVRLVIEEGKESVLVMKVVAAKGESVELATGGKLELLTGVLRIRERMADAGQGNGRGVGSLVFVAPSGTGEEQQAAKFQINILMSAKKFDALLQVALSGRLPTKFFVDAGERVSERRRRAWVTEWTEADQDLGQQIVPVFACDQLRGNPSDQHSRTPARGLG
jgi:hypothetical protein